MLQVAGRGVCKTAAVLLSERSHGVIILKAEIHLAIAIGIAIAIDPSWDGRFAASYGDGGPPPFLPAEDPTSPKGSDSFPVLGRELNDPGTQSYFASTHFLTLLSCLRIFSPA